MSTTSSIVALRAKQSADRRRMAKKGYDKVSKRFLKYLSNRSSEAKYALSLPKLSIGETMNAYVNHSKDPSSETKKKVIESKSDDDKHVQSPTSSLIKKRDDMNLSPLNSSWYVRSLFYLNKQQQQTTYI